MEKIGEVLYLDEAYEYLKSLYGNNADFRQGQLESILSVLNKKRVLVVQKTGWGKSLIYFLSTRMLRDMGKGPSIIISPLLSLINNQIESAEKLNLKAVTINSTNKDDWKDIENDILNNQYDVIFISPERLGNEEFLDSVLYKIKDAIGMLVVDEAHCISDWGHDFRPDYKRINRIIELLPPNIPFLATTATANDRVVNDIKNQLGENIMISRGPLTRKSINIQAINLDSDTERLAWIYENIKKINGTGIIYCLTQRDCNIVSGWLNKKGICVESYHAGFTSEERVKKEAKLLNNEVKALVATVALGMGFDKPDISFVIHYQRPGNVVAYYQQIGRAGRGIDNSYAILLYGEEDNGIIEYFIESAFPTYEEMQNVINMLDDSPTGLKLSEILKQINMKSGRLEKCLKFLLIDGAIYKERSKYYRSINPWEPDFEHSRKITSIRRKELKSMNQYTETKICYMEYISNELDDKYAQKCGKCSNCRGEKIFPINVKFEDVVKAEQFIKGEYLEIEPRKIWPAGVRINNKNKIEEDIKLESGFMLCSYGDYGWGKLVRAGKYHDNYFSEELVEAGYSLLKDKVREWDIKWITSIPSLRRPILVRSYAQRLAKKLGLFYDEVLIKRSNTPEQKTMENSFGQYENVRNGLGINKCYRGNVLIIDDMVDSRWTLTYAAYLLRESGSGKVFPFALAKTTSQGGD
ncbi:RecQ family ATP-dependent DNA helicase [Clostridium sp.]|uniref:RecQ family ATP-dependent DNA helicase n=1 Tax=Clostridium sp. TaxID=1506 RepID=UPI002FC58D5E